jgi:hypothetical protein
VVSFDDPMLARKREAGDEVLFIDGTHHSNLSRLVNDDTEAPNLKLVYSPYPAQGPPMDAAEGRSVDEAVAELPRRAFLVATVDVPAWTELTWDYGCHYNRHWLPWWQRRPAPPRIRRAGKSAPMTGGRRWPKELNPKPLWPNFAQERLEKPRLMWKQSARKCAPCTGAPPPPRPSTSDSSEWDDDEAQGEEGEAEENVEDVEALIEALDEAEDQDIVEEGEEWAEEVVLSRCDEGEDEVFEDEDDGDDEDKRSDEPELGLWEAIDLIRSSSLKDQRRALDRFMGFICMDPEEREQSAMALPGARRSRASTPDCLPPMYCEGCQLVRWPEPLFDAVRWPRTANRIIRDGMLRGRTAFALPKPGGRTEQRGICHCDEAGREAARLQRAKPILARDQAARQSATCGADHLLSAMVDAATDVIRAWDENEGVSDREAFLVALNAADVIFEVVDSVIDDPFARRMHAHCSAATGPLTKLWVHSLEQVFLGSSQTSLEQTLAIDAFQIFQTRAFTFFKQVFDTLPLSLDGLHWVGHACTQLTGESRVYDMLSLIAEHVRQPRVDFVAAGGCAELVARARARSFNISASLAHRALDDVDKVEQCIAMMAMLARDSAAAAGALVQAGAPILVAEVLMIHEFTDGLQRSELREALCSETLSALAFRSQEAANAVQHAMEAMEVKRAAKIAEDARRRELENQRLRLAEEQARLRVEARRAAKIAEDARRREQENQRLRLAEEQARLRAEARLAQSAARAAHKASELRKLPCERDWPSLTDAHQASAMRLGFTRHTWVRNQWHQVHYSWSELREQQNDSVPLACAPLTILDDALSLGFTEATWHGGRAAKAPTSATANASTKSGVVRCPWPQCNGRTFQQPAHHKDHCRAKHGGLLAPPGKSDQPPDASPPPTASALGKRPIHSASLSWKRPCAGPSSDASRSSASLAPPTFRLTEHGSTHQGTASANDALGNAFNTGGPSNVQNERELLSYEEAMAQGLLD